MERILREVEKWANSSHSDISESLPYTQGYKDGLTVAKKTVIGIIKECKEELNIINDEKKN